MTGWLGSSVVECSHGQRKAPVEPSCSPATFVPVHRELYSTNCLKSI